MRTESNREPEPLEIRKLGVTDGEPVVYLYLHSDVKQVTHTDMDDGETTMYTYDSTQVTVPVPDELLPKIDIALVARHDTNQTKTKQKAQNHLEHIKQNIKQATTYTIKNVDRLDRLTEPTATALEKIKAYIKNMIRL